MRIVKCPTPKEKRQWLEIVEETKLSAKSKPPATGSNAPDDDEDGNPFSGGSDASDEDSYVRPSTKQDRAQYHNKQNVLNSFFLNIFYLQNNLQFA